MASLSFVCPACESQTELQVTDRNLRCPKCGRIFGSREGVWSFTPDAYWGEISEQEMTACLQDIRTLGFDATAKKIFENNQGTFRFFFDDSRADWRFGMEIKSTDHVLDVGCGMGGNTFGLCDLVEEIVAFDLSWARAKFVQLRAEHEGKKNITVFAGDFMELPLPEKTFDVIVFNGILEWVGQSMKFSDPYEVQQWVMKKCFRLLKPGGRIYIGIENRYSLSYLFGPDHIGLTAVAWMPRWLARPYCRWRIRKDYRTYTHGKSGYVKLLEDGGFEDVRIMMPYPGYNDQRLLIPFENVACLRYAVDSLMGTLSWKKRVVQLLSSVPGFLSVYRYFFFSYDVYAVKKDASI